MPLLHRPSLILRQDRADDRKQGAKLRLTHRLRSWVAGGSENRHIFEIVSRLKPKTMTPLVSLVQDQKGLNQTVFAFADLGLNTEGLTILVSKSTLDTKPDLVARFVRATRKAIELSKESPDKAVAAAIAEKPQADATLLKAQLLASLNLLESPAAKGKPLGYMAPVDWAQTLELMKKYQDVSTEMKATEFYTEQFVEK